MGEYAPQTRQLKDGSTVILRSAVESDAAAFLEFHRHTSGTSLYVATSPDEITDTPEERAKLLTQFRERSTELLLLAIAPARAAAFGLPSALDVVNPDGRPGLLVGGVGLRAAGRRKLDHNVDLGMSLAVPWRGRGLGRVVLSAALDWAAAHPMIRRVTLGVIPENATALALYQSLGFEVEGVQKEHFRQHSGEYLDHILMAKRVKT